MNMIFIKPVTGRSVRDPETKNLLNTVGELKPKSAFWLKRIKEGDVVIDEPTKTKNKAKTDQG